MVSSVPATASPVPPSPASPCGLSTEGADGGLPPSPVDLAFVRDRSRVQQVRRIGTAWLRNVCRVSEAQVDAAEVVISELVSNAVLHGRADTVGVRLRHVGGQVRLEVNDHSPSAVPTSTRVGLDSEGGRGLWLVGSLVDELGGTWGFTADGTVAWCVFPSTPRSPCESRERRPEDGSCGLGSRRGRR
ncbi:ATP-binding protein [Streptomyces sp. AK08-02]|nr:ATP-binding protein [Streptomyces sp. AK08-02]